MENPENIEEIRECLRELVGISDALSEDETEQQTMEYLDRMTKSTIDLTKRAAWKFRQTADTLDLLWKNCKKAHVAGTSAGILGGILTIFGGVATVLSAGAATPLLFGGIGVGCVGAGTNIALSYIEAAMNSKEIEKAEMEWQKTVDHLKVMQENLQEWTKKSAGKLSLGVDDLRRLVRKVTPSGVALFCALMAELQAAGKAGIEATAAGAQGAAKAGAQGAAKAGAPLADDVLGAAAKAGAQSADEVAGAGAKVGAKYLGKVIIGVSAVFLVWDTIDLGLTIKDLLQEKGSEAAMYLRAKANQLDKICSASG